MPRALTYSTVIRLSPRVSPCVSKTHQTLGSDSAAGLRAYAAYYNDIRTRRSLHKAPMHRLGSAKWLFAVTSHSRWASSPLRPI